MIFKRAVTFISLLALSAVLFPLLAMAGAGRGIAQLSNLLFFWPQFMLAPFGFHDHENGHANEFLYDSAIYIAVAFWLLFAIAYGYFFRNIKIRYAALATYPVAFAIMSLFYWVLGLLGYSISLDGP